MGKLSRNKGKKWEQEVARRFRKVMPGADIKRGWQARKGSDAPDVDTPVFWVECKVGLQPNGRRALRQAAGDAPKGRVPIAVCRQNTEAFEPADDFVVLSLSDFLDFIGEWWDR